MWKNQILSIWKIDESIPTFMMILWAKILMTARAAKICLERKMIS